MQEKKQNTQATSAEIKIPKHPMYKQVPKKEADGIAWVFTNKDSDLVQMPYKFLALKDDQIRTKVLYSGLCHTDCLHSRSMWGDNVTYPISPGHEIIGEITKVGKGVKNFKVGEIIGIGWQGNYCGKCERCKEGMNNLCEKIECLFDPYFGGFGTHVQIYEKLAYKIPKGMPLERIPPLLCAGVTVYAPIARWQKQIGKDKKGLKVGVFGIGGLGHLAVQYLNKMGHKVTTFTTSKSREKELKELGAYDLCSSIDLKELGKVQGQYDLIINCLYIEDKEQFVAIQRVIRKGGTLVQLGIPPTRSTMALDVMNLAFNQISIVGSLVGSIEEMEEMLKFSTENQVYPTCQVFSFQEFSKALDLIENGRPKFRACVNVTDWAKKNGFDK